jgi:hemerythrin
LVRIVEAWEKEQENKEKNQENTAKAKGLLNRLCNQMKVHWKSASSEKNNKVSSLGFMTVLFQ